MAIVWSNKGTGTTDSDGFAATYGSNAAIARTIVDRAVADWNSVITNFNYAAGSGAPSSFAINISSGDLGGGLRGGSNYTTYVGSSTTGGETPTGGVVGIDDNGGGSGWFFDPTAGDDGEFNTNTYAFESTYAQSGAAADDADFYRTIVHEIGHVVGITTDVDSKLYKQSSATSGTSVDGSSLRTVPGGGGTTVTITTSGHIYEGAHPHELMNPGPALPPTTTRQLISDLDAKLLQQVYGYSIVLPSQLNSMLSNLTGANNKVTITGTSQANNVTIDYTSSGRVRTTITAGGVSYVESFAASTVSQVNAFTGNGSDTLNASTFTKKVYFDGGADNDQLTGGSAGDTLIGGNGNDTLFATGNDDGDDAFYASPDTTSSANGFVDELNFTSKTKGMYFSFGGLGTDGRSSPGSRNVSDAVFGGGAEHDIVLGFRVLRLGSGNDRVTREDYAGPLFGNEQSYEIPGNATIYGGGGNDEIRLNKYANYIDGGSGTDTATSDGDDILVSIEAN